MKLMKRNVGWGSPEYHIRVNIKYIFAYKKKGIKHHTNSIDWEKELIRICMDKVRGNAFSKSLYWKKDSWLQFHCKCLLSVYLNIIQRSFQYLASRRHFTMEETAVTVSVISKHVWDHGGIFVHFQCGLKKFAACCVAVHGKSCRHVTRLSEKRA